MKVSELRDFLGDIQGELEVVIDAPGPFFAKVTAANRAMAHDELRGWRKPVGCIVRFDEAPRRLVLLLDVEIPPSNDDELLMRDALAALDELTESRSEARRASEALRRRLGGL